MPPASERALALAREVLAKIASYDPYFPKPNGAMLTAWGEHISLKNPDRDDMLAAVTRFYEENIDGVKPMPATITTLARRMKTDRMTRTDYVAPRDKSDDPEPLALPDRKPITRAQWEELHGEKFPEMKVGGAVLDADREGNPLLVACPWCHSSVGVPCVVPSTGVVLMRHRAHDLRWQELGRVQA